MTRFLERYLHGEHERVWEELVALGEQVCEGPLYRDAMAVARETMRRARHNIEQLIPRLAALGYQFGYGWIQPAPSTAFGWQQRTWYRERLRWARTQPPILSLPSDVEEELADRHRRLTRLRELGAPPVLVEHQAQRIANLQAQPPVMDALDEFEHTVGRLPLAVRAWYETVGQVNFVGMHAGWLELLGPLDPPWPKYCLEEGGSPFSVLRPLYVHPMDVMQHARAHDAGSMRRIPFIPNEYAAYGEASQNAFDYDLVVPCLAADASLRFPEGETTFVAHLRESFRWGGFRGWAVRTSRPEQDLAFLTSDLLPI